MSIDMASKVAKANFSRQSAEVELSVLEEDEALRVHWKGAVGKAKYVLQRSRDGKKFESLHTIKEKEGNYFDPYAFFGQYFYRIVANNEQVSKITEIEVYAGGGAIHLSQSKPNVNLFNLVLGNCELNSKVLVGIYKTNGEVYRPFEEITLKKQLLVLGDAHYAKGKYIAAICIPDLEILFARFDVL